MKRFLVPFATLVVSLVSLLAALALVPMANGAEVTANFTSASEALILPQAIQQREKKRIELHTSAMNCRHDSRLP